MKINKYLVTLTLVLFAGLTFGQYCTEDSRFTDAEFFNTSQIDSLKDVHYASVINYQGDDQDLAMDIYFPSSSTDELEKRPFIMLIHGGGFINGYRELMSFKSKELAKRGYVSATMSYRLGFDEKSGDAAGALYRAQQDAHAALRYIADNAEKLGIDPDWLFVGGTSAGAFTSLISAYGQQAEWNMGFPALQEAYGPLESNGNDIETTFEIKGIFNHMGAVSPLVLGGQDLLPTISFHGAKDELVSIDMSYMGFGSRPLHEKLCAESVCNDITVVENGGHDIYWNEEGKLHMVNKVSRFFKTLFCEDCKNSIVTE